MSKTREELAVAGILLAGPLVPEFFKFASDGCSVPTGFLRRFLNADQTRSSCVVHDFEFYITGICFLLGSKSHKHSRQMADINLRWNRTKIGKNWITGQVFGRLYYTGVRLGGARAMRKKHGRLICPPSLAALDLVRQACVERCKPNPLTPHAKKTLKGWEEKIKEESK